jgi:hypothetical protein
MCSWMEMRVLDGLFRVGEGREIGDEGLKMGFISKFWRTCKSKREIWYTRPCSLCVYIHGALCTLIMS